LRRRLRSRSRSTCRSSSGRSLGAPRAEAGSRLSRPFSAFSQVRFRPLGGVGPILLPVASPTVSPPSESLSSFPCFGGWAGILVLCVGGELAAVATRSLLV